MVTGTPSSHRSSWTLVRGYLAGPGANLAGANLSGADLHSANFLGANLTGTVSPEGWSLQDGVPVQSAT
ncbi:MAG: pentapeptide repeat-containing protein [Actinobacteria bacterium]|nr:pentapeptide repeat-containing protein [Actinomycetota bacterium]